MSFKTCRGINLTCPSSDSTPRPCRALFGDSLVQGVRGVAECPGQVCRPPQAGSRSLCLAAKPSTCRHLQAFAPWYSELSRKGSPHWGQLVMLTTVTWSFFLSVILFYNFVCMVGSCIHFPAQRLQHPGDKGVFQSPGALIVPLPVLWLGRPGHIV